MEKLTMCRICLVENVRMYEVNNRNLQEVYEKLTDIPFVTEDSRPMLACFFCYAKLQQCWQLQRKCLKAEELFVKLLNGNPEYTLYNRNPLEFFWGFTETKLEYICLDNVCEEKSAAIKEELPDVCESQDDIELQVDHLSDDVEDDPLIMMEIKVEEVEILPKTIQSANQTDSTSVTKKTNEDEQKGIQENATPKKTRKELTKLNKITKKKTISLISKNDDAVSCNSNIQTFKGNNVHVLKCKLCNYIGINSNDIETHNIEKHYNSRPKDKPYKCDICLKSFGKSSTLKIHNRTHTGEKPYKCNICPKSFSVSGSLKIHNRTHTGEKPFMCIVCQKSFSDKNNLNYHIRVHTGVKRYKCDICLKRFTTSGILKSHIRTHTEKPYICNICQSSFSQLIDLQKHMRIHPIKIF